MPAEQATQGQGTQAANENASTPSTPEQATKDKQTTTQTNAEGGTRNAESQSDPLMDAMGIPADVQAQIGNAEGGTRNAESQEEADPNAESHQETEAEKPEGESETEPEPEEEDSEDEDDQDQEHEHEDKSEKPDKRQKRINRLTRQKRELEKQSDAYRVLAEKADSEAEKLRGELEKRDELKGTTTPATAGWFPDEETAQTHSTLSAERDKADAVIRWCNEHPRGDSTWEDGKEIFTSPEEVAQWKSRAEETRLRVSPEITMIEREAKQAYRVQKSQNDDVSKKNWPELFDKSTQAYQFAQSTFRKYPSIKESPEANWLLGVHLEGLRAIQERSKKANGNGADKPRHDISPRAFEPRAPIAPHTPEPPSREVTPSSRKKFNEAMERLVLEGGGKENLVAAFDAEDEMQTRSPGPRQSVRS